MDESSGVGVIDKAVAVLSALELGPAALAELVGRTQLPRPTAYRLAAALEHHGLVNRDREGRFVLGERLAVLAQAVGHDGSSTRLAERADPVLRRLRDQTGESAQLYLRRGDQRLCIAAAEPASGLRDTVPVGSRLTLGAGSAAQVLLAWEPADEIGEVLAIAAFGRRTLVDVRRRGWAQSLGQREPGVGSVSAPVHGPAGAVVAAVSVSGPLERLGRAPGKRFGPVVIAAAAALAETSPVVAPRGFEPPLPP